MNKNIKNYINSSSLGVYSKYIRKVNGIKYLVKSGRGYNENVSILEPVTECICYELAKLMNIPCAEYFSNKRIEFILNLLEERMEVVRGCFFQSQN